jgi:hypothetical protein
VLTITLSTIIYVELLGYANQPDVIAELSAERYLALIMGSIDEPLARLC